MNRRLLLIAVALVASARILHGAPEDDTGLRYSQRTTAGPQSIHILEIDPRLVRIEAVRALDDGVGRETVASMAQRSSALAAINAGFFRIGGRYDGEPDGILKIRGQWYSDPSTARGAIGWTRGGETARIGRVKMVWRLESGRVAWPVSGINRPRGPEEAILYGWAFHRSTLTDPGGTEFMIARGRVVGIERAGNAAIPADGFVYSVGPQAPALAPGLRVGARVKVTHQIIEVGKPSGLPKVAWPSMETIVGGVPMLLLDRNVLVGSTDERMRAGFADERHPRTAVALRADGSWVCVVVDGRQPALSIGMNLTELSQLLLELGCVDALNLDGGGSSTMVFQGKVVNSPSDATRDRPVSDAIIFLPRVR